MLKPRVTLQKPSSVLKVSKRLRYLNQSTAQLFLKEEKHG